MKKICNFLIIEQIADVFIITPSPKLQDDMGRACYIKYHPIQTTIAENDLLITVEAAKGIVHARSPLKGEIVAYNHKAIKNPALLNSADSNDNWILKLKNVDSTAFFALENYTS